MSNEIGAPQPLAPPSFGKPDWAVSAAVTLACFVLYQLTMCPTVFWYDSAEYATAAYTLGIPHPPGYPLYTMLGRLFVLLPMEPARAVNLMSAVFGALGVGLAWWVQRELGTSRIAAVVGAATLGTGIHYWNNSLIAEVYTPGLTFLLGVLLLLLQGLRRKSGGRMVLAAGLAGLGLGVHMFIATVGLGFAVLVLGIGLQIKRPAQLKRVISREQLGRRIKVAAAALGAAALGTCIFLWIPLRASMKPALNFSDPSNWERFSWFVTGGNYKGWFLKDYDLSDRLGQVGMIFYDQLLLVGLLLASVGAVALMRARPLPALALALMAAGNTYFFFNYPVHDVEVFFLPTTMVLCLLAGVGADVLVRWLAARAQTERRVAIEHLVASALCLLPGGLALVNYGSVDLSRYTEARDYGVQVCEQLPRNAVILYFTTPPEYKNSAVFANYYQQVLGRRPDIRVRRPDSPRHMLAMLQRGQRLYMYYPVPQISRMFELRKEGVLYRVVGPRSPVAP